SVVPISPVCRSARPTFPSSSGWRKRSSRDHRVVPAHRGDRAAARAAALVLGRAELGGAAAGWRGALAAPRWQAARRSLGLSAEAGGGRSGLLRPRPPADRALASSATSDR